MIGLNLSHVIVCPDDCVLFHGNVGELQFFEIGYGGLL
jgi:hypothetical protein